MPISPDPLAPSERTPLRSGEGARTRVSPYQPRGMTREMSADYCSLTPATFDRWVSDGRMPKPIPGTHRWDKRAIDHAWDKLSGLDRATSDAGEADLDEWARANGFSDAG